MVIFMLIWMFVSSIMGVSISPNRKMILYFVITTIIVIVIRLAYTYVLNSLRKNGRNRCNVIYIGSGSNLMELYDEMSQYLATGYNVVGYFDISPSPQSDRFGEYLGCCKDTINFLREGDIDRVYCGLSSKDSDMILPIINYCESHLIRFFNVPNYRDYCHRRVSLDMFNGVPLLTIHREPLSYPGNRAIKRAFDIIFSLCFLLVAYWPIYIIVGIMIKISSPGPILFKQIRHGLDGKEFCIYKFRSMRVNADASTKQATEYDPRKTKIGDLLRRTNIDELPQFINVFRGDMSIVGPRPHMVKHTEEYSKLIMSYMVRHLIKPGITGWAQVTGYRGETKELSQMEGRVKADIWYMEHWTFAFDLYIIYKTVANMVKQSDKTAY